MIDNFEIISNLIRRKASNGEFYFLQIYKRRKDNPDMEKDMIIIDNFFIKGEEDLKKKEQRIKEICTANNARAYIRLNKRSDEKVALQTLKLVVENIANKQYDIKNCYLSACGQYHSDENKTWVIDIDSKENYYKGAIAKNIIESEPIGEKVIIEIPTVNGCHFITYPFNVKTFNDLMSKDDMTAPSIHKDNPTILFIP